MKERRKTRKTARVFFSSPFGGLEEEREELTKRYWPHLSYMCSKAGYEFIPVDLRWGITSEMSSSASTIEICLREMDRSDMIVGFFGQRYGWHGDNELLQKSFDVAAVKYPWLNEKRGKSVTELEYLHGHLNKPGERAACFFFRDKSYDNMKLKEAEMTGEERQMRKFRSSTDGPKAGELLEDLKVRVYNSRDQCLAVHQNYKTPQEGARLMFETIEKYFREVLLLQQVEELSPLEKERTQHDTFRVSSLAMGDVYEGGESYLKEIDDHVASQIDSKSATPLLVIGEAGSGKSCMLSNWTMRHQEQFPEEIVVYHFIGCTGDSSVPRKILRRLKEELEFELNRVTKNDEQDRSKTTESKKAPEKQEIRDLVRELTAVMVKISKASLRAFVVIDALNKVADSGQTMKELFWLPKEPPPGIHIITSVGSTDSKKIHELVTERGYKSIQLNPLSEPQKVSAAMTMLKLRGKALSSQQKEKVTQKAETGNPLFLKILLKELCSFGEFFELDKYLDGLLDANSTKELFQRFLQRVEKDYNPNEYSGNMVKDIACCIFTSRQGLSEREIKEILHVSDQAWSSIYFAMDDFLTESSGVYSFSYDELSAAVKERYELDKKETFNHYTLLLADYFSEKLKQRSLIYDAVIPERISTELPWLLMQSSQTERLVDCITWPSIFGALRKGESQYDLMDYWTSTGLSGEEIVAKIQSVAYDHLALLYNEAEEKGDQQSTAARRHMVFLYDVAQFVEVAGHPAASTPLLCKAIQIYKSIHSDEEIRGSPDVAFDYCQMANTLACIYVDTEQFEKGEQLHNEVLELREKFVNDHAEGKSTLANTVNGLGVLCYKQKKYEEAEPFYKRCLAIHKEVHPAGHVLIPDTLNNIGVNYWSMGRLEDARQALEETVELYEEAYFGRLPPNVGGTLVNLAMVYRRLQDMNEKAEPLYKKALEIRINAYGPDHHEVGQTLLSYSAFLMSKESDESIDVAKRAAVIFETSLGLDHINTLNALENVALALIIAGKHEEAHPYFQKSGIVRYEQGRMDSSLPTLNASMADFYLNTGRNEDARQLFERLVGTSFASDRDFAALDYLDETLLGDGRPQRPFEQTVDYALEKFPSSSMLLGRKQGKLAEKGDAQSLIKILEKGSFGVEVYNGAYQAFVENRHRKEGMAILLAAVEKFPEDIIILHNLGNCYTFYKDFSPAAQTFKKLLTLVPDDASVMQVYGRVLALSGRLPEAKEQFERALELAQGKQDAELSEKIKSSLKLLNDM